MRKLILAAAVTGIALPIAAAPAAGGWQNF